ncbi:hypothetical protein [Corynebacterium dentalis]|uniref:hypothetical protein n=1 Tax=Corynebacterium dentalis TaxID=2014528 RepID=UPI00370D7F5C
MTWLGRGIDGVCQQRFGGVAVGVVAMWFGPGAGVENTKSFLRGVKQTAAIAQGVEAVEAVEFRVIEDFEGFGVEGQQAAVVGGD